MINVPRSRAKISLVNRKAALVIGAPISLGLMASGNPVVGSLVVGGFAGTFGGHLVRTAQILSNKPDRIFEMSRKMLSRATNGKFDSTKLILNSPSKRAGIYIGLTALSGALTVYSLSQSKVIAGVSAAISASSAALAGKEIDAIGAEANRGYIRDLMGGAPIVESDQGPTFPDFN